MEENNEDNTEINNNNINNINIIYSNNNISLENNMCSEIKTENNNYLPLLTDIISVSVDKENLKPPIYINELSTKRNYDDVNINTFIDIINNFLLEIKRLIELIENNFPKNKEKFFEVINKYNIPFMNFFYSLTFIFRELIIINSLISFKYSENYNNIEEYNKLKNKIKSENDFTDIDNYINNIKNKNKLFYDLITEEQTKLLKNHIIELLKLEEKMFEIYDNINFIPGLIPITICFNCIEMNVIYTIKSFQKIIDSNYQKKHVIMIFLSNLSKVNSLALFINNSCISFNKDNLLNQKENDSSIWKCIKEHYIKYHPYNKEIVDNRINKVLDYIKIGYASISKSKSNLNNKFLLYTSLGMYSTLYYFNKKGALSESNNFLMKPELEAVRTIWNMLDNPIYLEFIKILLPSIEYNHTFYIKRTQKEIDIKLVEDLCEKTKNFNPFNEEENKKINDLFMGENNENKYIENNLPLIKEKNKDSKTDENYVKIKVYNYEKLKINSKIKNESDISDVFNIKDIPINNERKKSIMFHVHGGGFIAMSPNSHENYTLKWANDLKIPIFSIDYRLSPGVAFPKALDDVYQSYIWIIKYSKIIFNIEFNEIIMTGDSAGGNLILSLTYLLIMRKVKLPKIIFMFYPALKIDINTIVPSYLNSMTDLILEYHLLLFCIDSYSGKYTDNGKVVTNTRNKFLSPLFMDDNVLKLLPPIRIFGGSCDPLRDDTFYLMEKLLKLNKDIFFSEFKYFPHGFLNYDFKMIFPECSLITDMISREIESFVK